MINKIMEDKTIIKFMKDTDIKTIETALNCKHQNIINPNDVINAYFEIRMHELK
jgi:hypothetical protein